MKLLRMLRRASIGPLVSVVMPVYNGAKYLPAALDSVLAQTYRNLEIIIINDGSNDDGATAAVVRRYRRWRPSIRYIEQPNGGVASALNAAILAMTGEFFCWLSHDDIFKPAKIARQVKAYAKLGQGNFVLFSDYELIDRDGTVTGSAHMGPVLGKRPEIARFRGAINGCTVFVPRRAFHIAGMFDDDLRYTQDVDLWDRMSDTHKFIHMPEALVQTRLHPEQGSRDEASIPEGNALWIRMADRTTPKSRGLLSGGSEPFYREFADFLDQTPYQDAAKEMRSRANRAASLVSVVIPVLNELHLAARAVDSVMDQTHQNVEVLVVLDAGAKGSDLDRFKNDPRVRTLRDSGGGSGAARNMGIIFARGDYVAFLDHDDWFLPTKIEVQLSAMIHAKSLISHTSYYAVYPARRPDRAVIGSGKFSGRLFPKIMTECRIALPTVMVHRALFETDLRFPEIGHLGSDTLLWVDVARDHEILGIDEPLTVVEWSDRSAAMDVSKLIVGITAIRDAYASDPFYARFSTEISTMTEEIERMKHYLQVSTTNEQLVTAAFNGVLA